MYEKGTKLQIEKTCTDQAVLGRQQFALLCMKKDVLLLNHILDAILKIELFTNSITKEEFIRDDKKDIG